MMERRNASLFFTRRIQYGKCGDSQVIVPLDGTYVVTQLSRRYIDAVTDDNCTLLPGQIVRHPGIVAADRTTHVMGRTRPFTASEAVEAARRPGAGAQLSPLLETGPRPLFDVMVAVVEATGADSGVVEFSGIALPRVSYCFPAYGDEEHPMLYSATHESAGIVLQGTATVGFRRDEGTGARSRWIHFHIAWVDDAGDVHGGHLWPETLMEGALMNATVWPLYGMTLVNALDEETLLPVFTPHPSETAPPSPQSPASVPSAPGGRSTPDDDDLPGDRDALFARVRPNEELVEVIDRLARAHGLVGGSIRGGTGSLVGGATFVDRKVSIGPASEIIALTGQLEDATATRPASLSCSLVVAGGHVHGGRLHPQGNLVGATYDLMLVGPADY